MAKQLRIDFPDYSAQQQEIDATRAERRQTKDIIRYACQWRLGRSYATTTTQCYI